MNELKVLFAELNEMNADFDAKRPFLLDEEHLQAQLVMQAYVSTAIDYLSQLAEPLLQDVVGTLQEALATDRLLLRAEANLMQAAIGEGMAAHLAARHTFHADRPTLLLPPERMNGQGEPQSVALLPLSLVGFAQAGQAAEMVGAVVYLGSVVRDFVNGRFAIDRVAVPVRGEAMMAHWLMQLDGVELGETLTAVRQKFPTGIAALPPHFRYKTAEEPLPNNIINLTDLAENLANR